MTEPVILTNMCMVTDGAGNVLVQNRRNPDWPGIVFPGGHVEPGESFVASVKREIWEETGLTIEDPRLCGAKQFWTEEGCRYVVLLFRATRFSGKLRGSEEGDVSWVPREGLESLALAQGFERYLCVFEDDGLSECFCDDQSGETLLL